MFYNVQHCQDGTSEPRMVLAPDSELAQFSAQEQFRRTAEHFSSST